MIIDNNSFWTIVRRYLRFCVILPLVVLFIYLFNDKGPEGH